MEKFKIHIPAKAIKEYDKKAEQAALAAGWFPWNPTAVISLVSKLVKDKKTFDEISEFVPENRDVCFNDSCFPDSFTDNWL